MANLYFCCESKRHLIFILTPLLLLLIPFLAPKYLYKEMSCAYCILIMSIYWTFEVLPLAITALLPLFLFPILGVAPAKLVSVQYLKDVNCLAFGGLSVAIAVQYWGLHKRIALKVLVIVGPKPKWLLFGFMITTAFLSMWISNVATTAMMIPISEAVLQKLNYTEDENKSPKKVNKFEIDELLSMEHLSKTSQENTLQEHGSNKSAFAFTEEHSEMSNDEETDSLTQNLIEKVNQSKKQQAFKGLAKAITICTCYSANIGGTGMLTGTGSNLILAGQFKQIYPESTDISFASWVLFAFPGMIIFLFFAWVWIQYIFLDTSDIFCTSRSSNNKQEKLTTKIIQQQYHNLEDMSFAEKSLAGFFLLLTLLWLTRNPGFVNGWGDLPCFVSGYITDSTVVIFITLCLFIFPSRSDDSKPATILNWSLLHKNMSWDVILLLGGSFAMAFGVKESGLSVWITSCLHPLKQLSPFLANVVCLLIVCLFTQCSSNVATATIFLPILSQLAEVLHVHPLYFMLPATLTTSYAFILPVSTPPNAIAYSCGHLAVSDMMRAGVMMTLLGLFISLFSISLLGNFAFSTNQSCPSFLVTKFCNATSSTNFSNNFT